MFDTVLLRPILSAFNVNVIPLCFLSFLTRICNILHPHTETQPSRTSLDYMISFF